MMAHTAEDLYRYESDQARAIAKRIEELAEQLIEESEKLAKTFEIRDEGADDAGGTSTTDRGATNTF